MGDLREARGNTDQPMTAVSISWGQCFLFYLHISLRLVLQYVERVLQVRGNWGGSRSVTNSSRSCRKCAMLNISYCTWEKWCVCAVFAVQGVLVGGSLKKIKTKQGRYHSWGHGIEYMASFSQFKKLCWGGQKILLGFWVSFDVSWWRLWNPIKTN